LSPVRRGTGCMLHWYLFSLKGHSNVESYTT
jgi:hypothetical protein